MKRTGIRFLISILLAALLFPLVLQPEETAQAGPPYNIEVDLTSQIVTIYNAEGPIACQFICSSGRSGSATPTGTYYLPKKKYSSERTEWYYFSEYNCYAKWATRIVGGILFHSVLYNQRGGSPTSTSVNALGSPASHGCIRLRVADARWIAENCAWGTRCKIYYGPSKCTDLRSKLLRASDYRSTNISPTPAPAPTPTPVPALSVGSTGDKVAQLQRDLKTLKLYDGEATGTYDQQTAEAVKSWQTYHQQSVTGTASDALCASISTEAASVASQFGDTPYKPVFTNNVSHTATVATNSGRLNVRSGPSTSNGIVGALDKGTVVTVLERGSGWSRVQYGSLVGYCSNDYLSFQDTSDVSVRYEEDPDAEPTPTPTPSPTPDPNATPTPSPTPEPTPRAPIGAGSTGDDVTKLQNALKALKLYDGEISGVCDQATVDALKVWQKYHKQSETGTAQPETVDAIAAEAASVSDRFGDTAYKPVFSGSSQSLATVVTRSSRLNVRSGPSTSNGIVGALNKGTVVTVLERGSGWSRVQYGSLVGYCSNDYLSFYDVSDISLTYEEDPDATPTPEASESPEPSPSAEPESSETPEPTPSAEPEASEEPEPTAEPTPSAQPEATEAPEPTPSAEPEPSDVPSEPVISDDTLEPGATGDAVKSLQNALKALKLLSGSVTGTYDDATIAAVKTFQAASKQVSDGNATPDQQRAIQEKVKELNETYPDGNYMPVVTTTTSNYAVIATRNNRLNVRTGPSTSYGIITSISKGTTVMVLEHGGTWSRIQYGGTVGYCRNDYLSFYSNSSTDLTYVPGTGETVTGQNAAEDAQNAVADAVKEEPTPEPSEAIEPEVTEPVEPTTEEPVETDVPAPADPVEETPTPAADNPEPTPAADAAPTETPTEAPTEAPTAAPTAAPTEAPKVLYAVVRAESAKLYAEPDVHPEKVVEEVPQGSWYVVEEADSEWVKLVWKNTQFAYVPARDVELTEVRPQPTPIPQEQPAEAAPDAEPSEAPQAEPTLTPETPQPEAAPSVEPEAQPEPASEPASEATAAPEPAPEPDPAPAPAPEPAPVPEPVPAPEPVTEEEITE